jgi:hypothetical protein
MSEEKMSFNSKKLEIKDYSDFELKMININLRVYQAMLGNLIAINSKLGLIDNNTKPESVFTENNDQVLEEYSMNVYNEIDNFCSEINSERNFNRKADEKDLKRG